VFYVDDEDDDADAADDDPDGSVILTWGTGRSMITPSSNILLFVNIVDDAGVGVGADTRVVDVDDVVAADAGVTGTAGVGGAELDGWDDGVGGNGEELSTGLTSARNGVEGI
jgi:hypothetical protein